MKCSIPLILIQLDYHLESHDAISFGSKPHCPGERGGGESSTGLLFVAPKRKNYEYKYCT
jgi:hypothetical protein